MDVVLGPLERAPWFRPGKSNTWSVSLLDREGLPQAGLTVLFSLAIAGEVFTGRETFSNDAGLATVELNDLLADFLLPPSETLILKAEVPSSDGEVVGVAEVPLYFDSFYFPEAYIPEIPSARGEPTPSSSMGETPSPRFGTSETPVPLMVPGPEIPASFEEFPGPAAKIALPGDCPPPQVTDFLETTTDEVSLVAGDPVFVHNGEFVRTERHLHINEPGFPLSFNCTYRSQAQGGSRLGAHWDFSWNKWLEETPAGFLFHNGFGRVDLFARDPNLPGGYSSPPGYYATLIENPQAPPGDPRYTILWGNDAAYLFDERGRLTAIKDRFGNTQRFFWDPADKLTKVLDTRDNPIYLDYDENTGLLKKVTDWTNRTIAFTHYHRGDRNGPENSLKSVDSSLPGSLLPGQSTSYTYAADHPLPQRRHDLLTISEPRSGSTLIQEFDDQGRPLKQVYEGGTFIFRYIIPGQETEVTDRLGNKTSYRFAGALPQAVERQVQNRLITVKFEHQDQAAGFLESSRVILPRGNEVRFQYDRGQADPRLRGRLLEVRRLARPQDGLEERRVVIAYEPNRNLITSITSSGGLVPGADPDRFTSRFEYDARGCLTKIIAPPASLYDHEGNVVGQQASFREYTYNDRGLPLRRKDASGLITRYIYADSGPARDLLSTIVHDEGGEELTTKLEHDALGRLVAAISPLGARMAAEYDEFNHVTAVTGVPGITVKYVYDHRGLHVATLTRNLIPNNRDDRLAAPEDLVPDPQHPWIRKVFEYDARGWLIARHEEFAENQFASSRYAYDVAGRLVEEVEPEGGRTVLKYDERGLLLQVVRNPGTPDESIHTHEFDENGNEKAYLDPEGHRVDIDYDGFDQKIKARDPLGAALNWTWDQEGRLVLVEHRDRTGKVLAARRFFHDEMGRPCRQDRLELDDSGAATGTVLRISRLFDPVTGLMTEEHHGIPAPGESRESMYYKYDRLARLESRIDPLGNITRFGYDAASRLNRLEDIAVSPPGAPQTFPWRIVAFEYNRRGWPIAIQTLAPDNTPIAETRLNYNSRGQVAFVQNANGQTSAYFYDGTGRLVMAEEHIRPTGNPLSTVAARTRTRYAFDRNSNLIALTDANNNTSHFSYDLHNRPIRVEDPGGDFCEFQYDRDSKRILSEDSQGTSVRLFYDAGDRLIAKEITPGPGVEGVNSVKLEWDDLDRLTNLTNPTSQVSSEYDSFGHLTASVQNGRRLERQHDALGRRLGLISPAGKILYPRDALGRIQAVSEAGAPNPLAMYSYLGRELVAGRSYHNGTASRYDYDTGGRLKSISISGPGGQPLAGFEFSLDPQGLCREIDYRNAGRYRENLDYDSQSRLVEVKRQGPAVPPALPLLTRYLLDPLGNRQAEEVDGTTISYQTNAKNQYLLVAGQRYDYDSRGDLKSDGTRSFFYDYRHRLVRAELPGGTVEFLYDEVDRIIERRFTPRTGGLPIVRKYLYEGYHCIEELDETGTVVAQYIYGDGLNEIVAMRRDGRLYFYHHQHLRSVSHITDENGVVVESYLYDAFGQITILDATGQVIPVSALGNPFGFTGLWYDPDLEAYYARTRFLDPKTGKFFTRDRLVFVDGPNLYLYVMGNPVTYVDPFGEGSTLEFLEGLKEGFFNTFAGGLVAGFKSLYELFANAGEYWDKIQDIAGKLSDPELREQLWEELKGAIAATLEEEWNLVEGLLEAIKTGAAAMIGMAVGQLLGYLLNKAVSGGIGGKVANVLGKISDRITGFLKRRSSGSPSPRSGVKGGWTPGTGPNEITVSPHDKNYRKKFKKEKKIDPTKENVDHVFPQTAAKILEIDQVPLQALDKRINFQLGGGLDKAVAKKAELWASKDIKGEAVGNVKDAVEGVHRSGVPPKFADQPRSVPFSDKIKELIEEAPPSPPVRGTNPLPSD